MANAPAKHFPNWVWHWEIGKRCVTQPKKAFHWGKTTSKWGWVFHVITTPPPDSTRMPAARAACKKQKAYLWEGPGKTVWPSKVKDALSSRFFINQDKKIKLNVCLIWPKKYLYGKGKGVWKCEIYPDIILRDKRSSMISLIRLFILRYVFQCWRFTFLCSLNFRFCDLYLYMHLLQHFRGLELKLEFHFHYFQTILLQFMLLVISNNVHFCGYTDHLSFVQIIGASCSIWIAVGRNYWYINNIHFSELEWSLECIHFKLLLFRFTIQLHLLVNLN